MRKALAVISGLILALTVCACAGKQKKILLTQESQVKLRSIQSRVFDTTDRNLMLRTVIATLQDLGFVIDDADETLGTVSATKLKGYVLRITVSVRPRGDKQMIVRSNAQYNLQTIEDPEPYQQFFTALSKALFLEAQLVEEKETQTESSVTNPYAANNRLNKNKKRQKLAYIPKTAKNERVSLRSEPKFLLEKDIKKMLKKHNFFDRHLNKHGSFANDFVDNGDGTITDNRTRLMWQKSGSSKAKKWKQAQTYVKQLNKGFAGYSDWRLPTIEELASLVEKEKVSGVHIDPVFDSKQKTCWSADYNPTSTIRVSGYEGWIVKLAEGTIIQTMWSLGRYHGYGNISWYIRAVRSEK